MMHELLFTFAIEKLGRIGLPGPALSPAMMMLCGQNQQLPLPGTVQSKTYPLPPWEISATRHMAGLLTTQTRVKEEDQRILYKDMVLETTSGKPNPWGERSFYSVFLGMVPDWK